MKIRLFAVLAMSLALPRPSSATTMVELGVAELTYVADLIAEAEVESTVAERGEGTLAIRSVSTLRLLRVVKGDQVEGDRVSVREWGGVIGTERTTLHSAPTYAPGERVFVFLEREQFDTTLFRTVGLSQGKYTLVRERDTGWDVTVRVQAPAGTVRFDEAQVRLPAARVYLDQLVSAVITAPVPPYRLIPGLPTEKDRAFRRAALAAGQSLDARDTIDLGVAP